MTVESGADLVASVPTDFFSDIPTGNDAPTPESSEGAGDGEIETLDAPGSVEGQPAEEPAEEPEEPAEEPVEEPTEPVEPPVVQAQADELPEGVVKGKDRNGKEGLFVEPNRWKTIYDNHKLIQQTTELLGEPVTAEALQVRNEAFLAQERLFNDVTSGDPAAQSAVLGYFLDEMSRAREEGAVGVDASIPFATTFYNTVKQRAPEAYAGLRMQAAKDLLGEMFHEAAEKGDDSLFLSAQHFARTIAGFGKEVTDVAQMRAAAERAGLPFYTKAEMQGLARGSDPVVQLRAENARLNAQLNGRETNNQTAQFSQWFNGTKTAVNDAIVKDAITPALESVAKAWEKFPADYKRLVVDPLHSEVKAALKSNESFGREIDALHAQARRATSAQVRDRIGQQIQQKYVNRARLAADSKKGEILKFAANWLKEQSQSSHARRQDAQSRTAPRASASAPPRSLLPGNVPQFQNGEYDTATALKQAMAALG